jgi:hypothetical protein
MGDYAKVLKEHLREGVFFSSGKAKSLYCPASKG